MQETVVLKKLNPVISRAKPIEEDEEWLYALVEKRIKNDSGRHIPYEEILAKRGLTLADIATMEDVEIE